ncbi:MAG: hypothetical protein A2V77_24935 [Anaeromyxobacter sp. RBG_16_69_14]|nr:MAG: hypothetical protein A2V77_24935 [Anaeromyxobacter sp. RBG_16_69_14]
MTLHLSLPSPFLPRSDLARLRADPNPATARDERLPGAPREERPALAALLRGRLPLRLELEPATPRGGVRSPLQASLSSEIGEQ